MLNDHVMFKLKGAMASVVMCMHYDVPIQQGRSKLIKFTNLQKLKNMYTHQGRLDDVIGVQGNLHYLEYCCILY